MYDPIFIDKNEKIYTFIDTINITKSNPISPRIGPNRKF